MRHLRDLPGTSEPKGETFRDQVLDLLDLVIGALRNKALDIAIEQAISTVKIPSECAEAEKAFIASKALTLFKERVEALPDPTRHSSG